MSNQKKDGGSVYPHEQVHVLFEKGHESCAQKIMGGFTPGMTMRQAYKLAALQGIMGNETLMVTEIGTADAPTVVSKLAGVIADAMLAEDEAREKNEI